MAARRKGAVIVAGMICSRGALMGAAVGIVAIPPLTMPPDQAGIQPCLAFSSAGVTPLWKPFRRRKRQTLRFEPEGITVRLRVA